MQGERDKNLTIKNKLLIEGLISGERTSFESIFNLYYNRLLFFAREFIYSKEIAKELIQDTFLKVWKIRETLTPDTDISALLFTIIRNKCLNHLKHLTIKQKYLNKAQQENKQFLNKNALENQLFDALVYDELCKIVFKAIEDLTPRCREIFKLSREEGLSYKEIANKLGISINTVENQMVRSLKKIRQCLNTYNRL